MQKIRIRGGIPLRGIIKISGAKNAILPAIAASILTEEEIILENVPNVKDVYTMLEILNVLGGAWEKLNGKIKIRMKDIKTPRAPYELVKTMRASILVMGPLLSRFKKAEISHPGGCAIGLRPIDLHLEGLKALGASIKQEFGYDIAESKRLIGTEYEFKKVTVTGTENLVMAATLAEGMTLLLNCAKEPEVIDLIKLLNKMGAKIEGAGTERILIEGVKKLNGTRHSVISDRIETGTYMVASAITGGELKLENVNTEIMENIIIPLKNAGAEVGVISNNEIIVKGNKPINPLEMETAPYPGFPTDMQAQFVALLTQADGISKVKETIFSSRFHHVSELVRMGAKIEVDGDKAIIYGKTQLQGAEVMANDLRASASLVLAGLVAKGETIIDRVYHLDRGYEKMEEKLRGVGAEIERIE
ncbi:MAG: UDP-N-acetylglucosamine 1-carboxyvinyltransferase [Acidobacteriota bacterium]